MTRKTGIREPLSEDELAYIRRHAYQRTDKRIAQALGRHEVTIARKRREMVAAGNIEPPPNRTANGRVKRYVPVGTRLRNPRTGPFSESEWQYINEHLSDDPRDVARHLHRYPIVVYNALRRLRDLANEGVMAAPETETGAKPEPEAGGRVFTEGQDEVTLAEQLFSKYYNDGEFMLGLSLMWPHVETVDHFMAINQDTPLDKRAMILAWVRKYLAGQYGYILLDIVAPKGGGWIAAAVDTLKLSGVSDGTIPPDVRLLVREHSGDSEVFVNVQIIHINGRDTINVLFDLVTQRVMHMLH